MADDDKSEITKLIIYGFGIGAIVFFAYLIFKGTYEPSYQNQRRRYGFMADEIPPHYLYPQFQQAQPSQELQTIQQKLSQLETKIDNFVKSTQVKQNLQTSASSDRQTVSMKSLSTTQPTMQSLLEIRKLTRDYWGMR